MLEDMIKVKVKQIEETNPEYQVSGIFFMNTENKPVVKITVGVKDDE